MSVPEIGSNALRPALWAQRVSRSEPHGLDVLEARVLAYTTEVDQLAKTPAWRIAWGVSPLLALLASIGGFAAVFGNPRDITIGRVDEPDASDIPWAMVSYGVAAVGVVLIFVFWFTRGRRRNGALLMMLGLTSGLGVVGVLIAHRLAAESSVPVGPTTLLPAYVMMALAVIVFVIILVSPPMDPQPDVPPVPIDELGEKAMKYLMKERGEAIDALSTRRMLPDVDVEVLKARPLGRLHIDDDG